jgi:hypothetical protein
MFPLTSRVTRVCAMPGVYRLYDHGHRVGEAIEGAVAAPLAAA